MKKLSIILLAFALIFPFISNAQVYQLPNGGFENWDGGSANEPTSWNGFPSSYCGLSIGCGTAQQTRHEQSSDVRPGSTGSYSCKIFATQVSLLIVTTCANGNITTGQINIGGTNPSDGTVNYNVTKRATNGLNQPFNGKPDSIVFWSKFNCPSATQYARMNCVIHDDFDMQDPVLESQASHVVGISTCEYLQTNGAWRRYSVPVNYNYTAQTPHYMLITFTTNKNAGEGSNDDNLWIDDVEMIYLSTLSDLKSNGVTVPNFNAATHTYNVQLAYGAELPTVTATAVSANATVEITQPTTENPTATIVVTQGPSTTTYTINYTFGSVMDAALADLQVNGVTVPNFDPTVLEYNVSVCGTQAVVTATPRSELAGTDITQPSAANDYVGTVVCYMGDSMKTYTVNVTLVTPSADLASLMVNGALIEGFDANVTEYVVNFASLTQIPTISATPVAECANVAIVQATADSLVATATVTCNELTKVYTVQMRCTESIRDNARGNFVMYPNPTDEKVNIVLQGNATATAVVIYNMAGQVVKSESVSGNNIEVDFNDFNSGIYFVELRDNNQIVGIQKIVKR